MKFLPIAYLASHVLSLLGNSITGVALPLIVLQVTGSALGAGTVAAATAIPAVLAGLFIGVVIDRINRRTASVLTDLVSAAAIAALPIVDLISGLNLGWFILFGILGSLGDAPGFTAREALLPAIVRHGNITAERLLGVRESLSAVAIFIGPAAAGTLMVLFDGSTVLWISAATSLTAALITLLLPRVVGLIVADDGTRASTPTGSGWAQLRDGWRHLFRNPFLVAITALSLASVIVLAGLQGLVLPVYFTQIDEPGLLGFVLSALAAGMLLGGATYAIAGTRGPRRTWFVVGMIGTTLGIALLTTLSSVWVVFAGAFLMGLASGLFGSLTGVLMIDRIPEQLRGRILGTQNALTTAAPSAGIMLAAVLSEYAGVGVAALALLAVWLIAFVYGLAARSLRTLEPHTASAIPEGVR